ncbi:MAG: hypothetical protein HQM08_10605 [Candidatus Riflebacteria bacterium]|nr:hypothetical protein [Candidatus Riflebacteria bacterium]
MIQKFFAGNLRSISTIKKFLVIFLFVIFPLVSLLAQNSLSQKMKIVFPQDPDLMECRVSSVALGGNYTAWGTSKGVLIETEGGYAKWYNQSNSPLPVMEFPTIAFYGPEIWVGCRDQNLGGVFKFDGTSWTAFNSKRYSMLAGMVNCLVADKMNRLWIGFQDYGINRYMGWSYGKPISELFKGLKVKHGLISGTVYCMADGGRYLWVGTNRGLAKMDTWAEEEEIDHHKHWNLENGFPAESVFSIAPYGNDSVAVGTDLGLILPDGDKWKILKKKDGLISIPIKSLVSEGNRLWLGTNRGLQCYENGKLSEVIDSTKGLPSDGIQCLAGTTQSDGSTKLFVGTNRGARIVIFNR